MLVQNQSSKVAKRKKTKINISLKKKQKNNKQKRSSKKKKLKRTYKKYIRTGGMLKKVVSFLRRDSHPVQSSSVPSNFYMGESIFNSETQSPIFSPLEFPGLPEEDKNIKKIAFFKDDTGYTLMLITSTNKGYVFGVNNGKLPGYDTKFEQLSRIRFSNKDHADATDMVMGKNLTLILTNDGSVFGVGNPSFLGWESERLFHEVFIPHKWSQIWSSTVRVSIAYPPSQAQEVVHALKTLTSQPGLRPSPVSNTELNTEKKPRVAQQVVIGEEHLMILMTDKTVWAAGENSRGQLGVGKSGRVKSGKVILLNELINIKVKQIATAGYTSFILDDIGNVYSCGANNAFQTGLSNNEAGKTQTNDVTEFTKVDVTQEDGLPVKVTQIAMGNTYTMLLTENGQVYTCGTGNDGQLGLGLEEQKVQRFKKINLIEGMKCRKIFASNTGTIILTSEFSGYKMFACGSNIKGNLGLPKKENYYNFTEVTSFDYIFKSIIEPIKQNILTTTKELTNLVKYWSEKIKTATSDDDQVLGIESMTPPPFEPSIFLRDFLLGDRYEDAHRSIMSPLYEYIEKNIYMGDETTLILLGEDQLDIEDIKNKIEKGLKCHMISDPQLALIIEFLHKDENLKSLKDPQESLERDKNTFLEKYKSLFSDCDDFTQVFGITP